MKDKFDEIRALALPYQDQRDDEGHATVTQEYADAVGADGYAADASATVKRAKDLLQKKRAKVLA